MEEGISGTLHDPEYFRIWPYEASDSDRYSRPDRAHEEVLRWIRSATSPVLYLTGRSGTGKSSLLNAWVLPKLMEDDPPYQTLVVRSYGDPLAELVSVLGKPRTIWEKPPSDLPADPRARLKRAAAHLGAKQRLLIVLDQFEEFVILHEPERRAQLEALLRDLIKEPIPTVTTLLVLRTDYLGALDLLDLPLLRQRDNWREVGPFTQAAAAAFLDRSGLKLGPELRAEILKEAGEVEENPGLIRPITLNMFGLVLSRFEGRLPRGFAAGRLLTSYLRDQLNKPEVREHAVAIVRHMVTDAGTKRPRSEADLAARTELDPKVVRGCLLALGNVGLVRPLDEVNRVWDIAHDFVARLLAQVVGSWRTSWWQALRPWVAPASVVLWFAMIGVAIPAYRANVTKVHLAALDGMGIPPTYTDDGFHISFPDSLWDEAASLLETAAPHLQEIRLVDLDLSGMQLWDAAPLAKLTNLQSLDLSGTPVADAAPLSSLTDLQSLDLSGTPVADAAPLSSLTDLQSLALRDTQVADAAPLAKLTNLQSLDLSGTRSSTQPRSQTSPTCNRSTFPAPGSPTPHRSPSSSTCEGSSSPTRR